MNKTQINKNEVKDRQVIGMKYLIASIFVFIASNCFAIDQKLVNGTKTYKESIKNLRSIEVDIRIEMEDHKDWLEKLDEQKKERKDSVFYSPQRIKFYRDKIKESKKSIEQLTIKYNETKKEVKRLKPMVDEYNKQIEIERKREDFKDSVIFFGRIIGLAIGFLLFITFLSRMMAKRYKRLLKEGKITQEEYDQVINNNKSTLFDDKGTNPATGLPLTGIGISDVGGNVRGSSSDRHRRDRFR